MFLYIFVALTISTLTFHPHEVKADGPVSLLNPTDLTNTTNTLGLLKQLTNNLPNVTDHLTKIRNILSNSSSCDRCKLNTSQLCEYYGYKSEVFYLITTDGYRISIVRCYPIKINRTQPILLIHGMMDTSDTWFVTGKHSLAIKYVELGYDVYAINCRGNRYSSSHIRLSPADPKFWDFSWQEMAKYDVPETIDLILRRTGAKTILCNGHSQGGTVLVVAIILHPRLNNVIAHAGLLAPFVFLEEVGFPINVVIEFYFYTNYISYDFLPRFPAEDLLVHTVCGLLNGAICNWGLDFILGKSVYTLDAETLIMIFCHFPASCSTKQMQHFGQEFVCKYFGDMMKSPPGVCGTPKPYNTSLVTVPFSVFWNEIDPHIKLVDIKMFAENFPNSIIRKIKGFNHIDFVWFRGALKHVYEPLIQDSMKYVS